MRGTHGWAEVSRERKREIIDAIVANTLREEPTLLAAWTAARRVPQVHRAPAAPIPPTPAASVKTPETGEAA